LSQRIYYTDPYLRIFDARVVDRSPDATVIYLDRTAFYPTSGGQPHDLGTLNGTSIVSIDDEDERIAHRLAAPLFATEVAGSIDWTRRFDHMQQHTGQHLLSALFEECFALRTVSFHLGAVTSTIDLEGGAPDHNMLIDAERRANEVVTENRPVTVTFEDAGTVAGLRKPSDRQGVLRIVTIDGLDRSACGGTHVRATGEIGAVCIRRTEKIRQATRVEFVCGGRAVRRARADFEALSSVAQLFTASLDDAPAMAASLLESQRSAEKTRRKLELDLAAYRGKELYAATSAGPDGIRRVVRRAPQGNLEDLRALAQTFTAQPKAVFLGVVETPPSLLLATSEDAAFDAGKILKAALNETGGRGGGNSRMAQGSVPDAPLLEAVLAKLPV
jgi:alanyl-tRNA synthetase